MIRPNYGEFRRSKFIIEQKEHLSHSAKGSVWEDHKYIKRVDGTYYYPDSYEGGRHLPEGSSEESKEAAEFNSKQAATEFNKFLKQLSDAGQAYFGNKDEWAAMSLEEFKDLYKDILGRDPEKELSNKALKEMFESAKRQNTGQEKPYSTGGNKLSNTDVENLAKEVIRGNFGVGSERKELLGENYAEVQKRVNELMRGSTGSRKTSEVSSESIKKAESAAEKASSSETKPKSSSSGSGNKIHSGVDMDRVLNVYDKKRKR